ncbi:MAG: bifunctional precorrin-2 dehydrogenase/sirohydrochlorin ferrochelatase [Bacteroidota bacterium]
MSFMDQDTGNTLFPIFIKLDQIHTLVVGGGYVGLEKLEALLKNCPRARITLVAKEILQEEIRELAKAHPHVELIERPFEEKDLDEKDFVILATDDSKLHENIKTITRNRNIITNVADTPKLCDAYLGSVVKKGDLKIAISTNGKSPTISKRMREYLTEAIPDTENMQELLDNMKEIRDRLKGDFEYKVKMLDKITQDWLEEKKKED